MDYQKTCEEHALPENFESMDYLAFLGERRLKMAQVVKKAYQKLCE